MLWGEAAQSNCGDVMRSGLHEELEHEVQRLVAAVRGRDGRPGSLTPAEAERIVLAVLWLTAVPADSAASIYAAHELAEALGTDRLLGLSALIEPLPTQGP